MPRFQARSVFMQLNFFWNGGSNSLFEFLDSDIAQTLSHYNVARKKNVAPKPYWDKLSLFSRRHRKITDTKNVDTKNVDTKKWDENNNAT